MSEVGAADRSRLLRSKRAEIEKIIKSRKRKLRELFAVCDSESHPPQITLSDPDTHPTYPAESHFLDASDITRDRIFDECNLPRRRHFCLDVSAQTASVTRPVAITGLESDSGKHTEAQHGGQKLEASRASPSRRNDAELAYRASENTNRRDGGPRSPPHRPAPAGAPVDPTTTGASREMVPEPWGTKDIQEPQRSVGVGVAVDAGETPARINGSSSPAVDPRKVMPILAEDAGNLDEPLVEGFGSHDGHHHAKTVHLPPKEAQEAHLRQIKSARANVHDHAGRLSINLPPLHGGRLVDPVSSPGSTVDAHSATTPALHEASTDTSPDNETSHYDGENLEHKGGDDHTLSALRPSPEALHEKEEHDQLLKAQIAASREAILGSSPTAADTQLRMEEEAASQNRDNTRQQERVPSQTMDATSAQVDSKNGRQEDTLTMQAEDLVEDVVDSEEQDSQISNHTGDPGADVEMPIEDSYGQRNRRRTAADSEENPAAETSESADIEAKLVKDPAEIDRALVVQVASTPSREKSVDMNAKSTEDRESMSSDTQPLTRRGSPPSPAAASRPVERMMTRVSSGAMKHKSVSEILGEIPRPNTMSSPEKGVAKGTSESDSMGSSGEGSRSGTPQSPGSRARRIAERAREKERSKLSMVVFAKQAKRLNTHGTALVSKRSQTSHASHDDYFTPLFLATTSTQTRSVPVENLLQTAHKTITTSNACLPIKDNQTTKVLKRIYNLQSSNKWSLRQPRRAPEPVRPTSHWDILIQEAKWMQTDFKEERKWKISAARNLALACLEYHQSSPGDRKLLQVNAVLPKLVEAIALQNPGIDDVIQDAIKSPDADAGAGRSTYSLMDDYEEEPRLDLNGTVAPTAIFALREDDIVFGLRRSPVTDKLLQELPIYGSPLSLSSNLDPDRLWRREALPLSKYVEGRMVLKVEGPPRKRSRYEYEDEDAEDREIDTGLATKRPTLTPELTDVALFNPEHKHIRDRIHAGHQFRPPSEYQMPLQSFFECRTASQWTWAEDDELKGLVREYSYNWSLISSMLSTRSMFSSGAERRTPWECFERWIHLEGLPADMQKTHYFRAYTSRVEAANRNVMAQAAQAPQQVGPNGQVQPPPRRRTTTSVRVERRRSQKHLTLVDAMRKLAKKRETSQQKQQHVAGIAAMRKANEVPQHPRGPVHTPQDFSRLRQERDDQLRERLAHYQARNDLQRRNAILQARNANQNPQQLGLPPNAGQPRAAVPANGAVVSSGTPNSTAQNLAVPGQNRPRPMAPLPGQLPMPNLRAPLPMTGVHPPPMQGQVPGQLLPDLGLVTQAHQISQQQRQAIQARHQNQVQAQMQGQLHSQLAGQSPQMHTSPPRVNGLLQAGFNIPPTMMPPYNTNPNGISTPPPGGMVHSPNQGQSGSPRIIQQTRVNNHIQAAHIEQQIKEKYPSATPEQIMRLVSDTLTKTVHQRQGLAQSAMNAAAGGPSMNGSQGHQRMPSGVESSPQLYAQMLRQQQENQQKAAQQQQAASTAAMGNGNGQVQGNGNAGHAHRRSSSSLPGNHP